LTTLPQSTLSSDFTHIVAKDLVKHYELGSTIVKALDGITLSIKRGEMIIIVGPSGSGKSTLINMLGGVDKPDHGTVLVGKQHLDQMTDRQLTLFRRNCVGFVFQFYSLIPTLTAQENVEMAAELVNIKGRALRERSEEVIDAVGLKGRERSYPSQLSGGERQRVALARALAKRPELILVDEPTGQLDTSTGREMVRLVRDTGKQFNSTIIMVTHDHSLLEYGDRVITMESGKIIEHEV
jgi:putative ABC transport system ATP-binding protein